MDRDQALIALSSEAPSERLEAARYLQFWAVPTDIPVLRSVIYRESVGWIKRALEAALIRLGDDRKQSINLDDLLEDRDETSADVAAISRALIARTVVHELGPIAASIHYFADTEWAGYKNSRTSAHVDRLGRFISAIETLGGISNRPSMQRSDLAVVIAHCVEAQQTAFDILINVDGPRSMMLNTDPYLVELIVSNGLKNACEAAISFAGDEFSVSVIYGRSDRVAWVIVIDNGEGLPPGSSERLFDIGLSTKEDHLGMGLALSSEAAKSLKANIQLSDSASGTKFEFSWPANEDIDAPSAD